MSLFVAADSSDDILVRRSVQRRRNHVNVTQPEAWNFSENHVCDDCTSSFHSPLYTACLIDQYNDLPEEYRNYTKHLVSMRGWRENDAVVHAAAHMNYMNAEAERQRDHEHLERVRARGAETARRTPARATAPSPGPVENIDQTREIIRAMREHPGPVPFNEEEIIIISDMIQFELTRGAPTRAGQALGTSNALSGGEGGAQSEGAATSGRRDSESDREDTEEEEQGTDTDGADTTDAEWSQEEEELDEYIDGRPMSDLHLDVETRIYGFR